MVGQELHLDRTTERKTFAPGYGEFLTGGAGGDVEALAVAVPADALSGGVPVALGRLGTAASGMLAAVEARDWRAARTTLRRLRRSWHRQRRADPPPLIAAGLHRALRSLSRAVRHRRSLQTIEASLDVQQSVLDQRLRYEPRGVVDRDRLELWCQRLRGDARVRRAAAVSGDAATMTWIRDRIAGLTPKEQHSLDAELSRVQAAADARRTAVAADHAARLIGLLRAIPRLQAVD
jgi:hypothetical protein